MSYAFYAREIQLLFCDLTGADTSNVYGSGDYTDAATSIMQYLCLNTRRAPFDNPAVRRAVTLGVDRAGCVSAFLLGHGMAAHFPCPRPATCIPRSWRRPIPRTAMPPPWRRRACTPARPGA